MNELEAIWCQIKQMFAELTPEERQIIVSSYCKGCWIWDPNHTCQCRNDE